MSAHILWKVKRSIEGNGRKNELIEQSQGDLPEWYVNQSQTDSIDEQNRTPSENECTCVDIDREQKLISWMPMLATWHSRSQ